MHFNFNLYFLLLFYFALSCALYEPRLRKTTRTSDSTSYSRSKSLRAPRELYEHQKHRCYQVNATLVAVSRNFGLRQAEGKTNRHYNNRWIASEYLHGDKRFFNITRLEGSDLTQAAIAHRERHTNNPAAPRYYTLNFSQRFFRFLQCSFSSK